MSKLDPRKQSILRAIVVEYVSGAEPVASEQLVQKYELGVKSATVRNEMAEMVELGYLEQPHTSAGRIPSDLGYRYYVDQLVVLDEINDATKVRVRDIAAEGEALQGLLRDTTRALSRVTQLLCVATTIRDSKVTVLNAVVSALGPNKALLVLIMSNGLVENRMIECPPGLTLSDVGVLNDALALALAGKSLTGLAKAKTPPGGNPAMDRMMTNLWTAIRSIAREHTRGKVITEGEEFMFAQPEFQRDLSSLHDILSQLTESEVLYEALSPSESAQLVTIGRENRHSQMQQFSVIRRSFFIGENEAGIIALVGPTRMRYDMGIPLVDFTADALSASLTRFLG